MVTKDQVVSASGRSWLRKKREPGGGVCKLEGTVWGSCLRVLQIQPVFSPCLPGLPAPAPTQHRKRGCPVRAPSCGSCPDDCQITKIEKVCLVVGQEGAFRAPGLLGPPASRCCVFSKLDTRHLKTPPISNPACPGHGPICFLESRNDSGSWPEKDTDSP